MKKLPERFTDLLNREYRWPKKGDRLLSQSDDWNRGVRFSKEPLSRHVHLWDGYLSAADGLIQLCTQKGYAHERHFVVYPILFNYRHGLELAIKWHIVMYGGQSIQGIIKPDEKEPTHDLWWLWQRCRAIVEQHEDRDGEADSAVEQIVKDFHDLDRTGITFRYGWTKDRQAPKLPDDMIDLENIRNVMAGIANYFDGLDGWLADRESAGPRA